MKILFLDQSGKLGGAELSLTDVASAYKEDCLVGLFADGPFRELLEQKNIPHKILTKQLIRVNKDSNLIGSLQGSLSLLPLIFSVAKLARQYDVIYANTQKALVVGAIASLLSQKPLVYHLRDILSADHFSQHNRAIAIWLANQFAASVIANSQATKKAFIAAGGKESITHVVYNGFTPEKYQISPEITTKIRESLNINNHFVIGHFSRLSPWKGQHILLDALVNCPPKVIALLVGDALFGEDEYVKSLQEQVKRLGLENRVQFLGFRSDIPQLMSACDGVVHTSTAPEPFGRVIIEAMLCGVPIIGTAAGGIVELINDKENGWLCPPKDSKYLAEVISNILDNPNQSKSIAQQGQQFAKDNFAMESTQQKINTLLADLCDIQK